MLKLMSVARDYGACTHIRIRQIVKEMIDKGYAKVWEVDPSQPMNESEKIILKGIDQADLIWFGRSVSRQMIDHVKSVQANGKKVLFDLDDFVLDISPWSAHYDLFGTEEFTYDGKAVWKDKVNIDLVANRKRREEYIEFLGLVDAISVTTPRLMECYKPYTKKIYVFPNTIDMKVWDCGQTIQRKKGQVTIFWQGGISHYEDFWEIKEVIKEITEKYPQVHWVMMGAIWEHFWKDIPKERYEYINWVHTEAYPYRMKLVGADIGIAPLADTRFNKCKSSIKFYEYTALWIPTVASNIPPYSDDIWDGKSGYLASNPKEWVEKLSALIENSALRNIMAMKAMQYIQRERTVEVVTPLIVKAMEAFVAGRPL